MGLYTQTQEATRNDSLIVTNTSVEIASARQFENQPRKVITIRNVADDPTKIITCNLGSNPAVVGKGIVLRQYESFTDANDGQYICYQGTINAICAVASVTADIAIFER